ncbi:MAG: hypothetical protein L0Y54_14740 [Sporichthyaceae bacterium]|nr:hypothetical protein [Sporichthyaceae bacterium]
MSKHNASAQRPITLTITGVIVAAQGALLVAAGLYLIGNGVLGNPTQLSVAIGTGLFSIVGGLALLLVAAGLLRMRVWSRSPAILWQLLTIGVGWYQLQAGLGELGIPLIAVAVATAMLLLTPSATAALEHRSMTRSTTDVEPSQ